MSVSSECMSYSLSLLSQILPSLLIIVDYTCLAGRLPDPNTIQMCAPFRYELALEQERLAALKLQEQEEQRKKQ